MWSSGVLLGMVFRILAIRSRARVGFSVNFDGQFHLSTRSLAANLDVRDFSTVGVTW